MSKLVQTMIKKYGSEEAWKEHMRSIAAKGGSKPTLRPKGFAANAELARRAGQIGGKISRRGKANDTTIKS